MKWLGRDRPDEFDQLVEQQDQEAIRDGSVSPFTRAQLQAYAEGRPVPHVNVHSPEMQRATARLLRKVRRFHGHAGSEEDDAWFDDDEEA